MQGLALRLCLQTFQGLGKEIVGSIGLDFRGEAEPQSSPLSASPLRCGLAFVEGAAETGKLDSKMLGSE